jgi:hypothetical protein
MAELSSLFLDKWPTAFAKIHPGSTARVDIPSPIYVMLIGFASCERV